MGDKKQILELEYKLGKFDVDEEQRELEKNLKRLSDQISRTKTAKEFFDRMLGMTGDKELSATLTLSVYGTTGDDLQRLMTKQVEEAFKNLPKGFDITKAMLGGGKFDYNLLESWIEKLPKDDRTLAQSIVDNWRKANADILTDLQKSYEDFMTYEERKTRVVERQIAERKKIEESQYDDDEKTKLIKASEKSRDRELTDIAIEEFKASKDWAKSFEDLENLATPTIERLMTKLKEFIDLNKEDMTPEQVKTLTKEYQKLYDGLIQRNPFKAISDGVKEYKLAIANIQDIQRQLDFALELGDDNLIAQIERDLTDAFDEAQKASTKLKKGVDAVGDQFSQAASDIQFFANALGFSEDSYATQFLNGMANAFKGVSIAIGFADIAMKIFDGTIKGMLASNPIGWILLAVSAIISAVQAIMNARINRINKEIEALEDKLDNLEYAYDRLQKSAERAFGTEYIQNYQRQLDNLEAQVEAYEKQLDLERSKGKKADEEKIKEYQEQIRDTKDTIEDMYGSLSEHFLGTDLTSAARDFASAWIDAYKEFANTTDAMKAKFQEMIQNMIVESLIAKVMGLEAREFVTPEENAPVRPPVMCAGCPHRGTFYVLKKLGLTVSGDIGCYTLGAVPPLCAVDSTLCMGASVSGVHGFNRLLEKQSEGKTVAVIGDSTFMHSGVTGLINIAYNQSNSTVIILDNSITGMTGHQQNPTTGYNIKGDPALKVDLEALCRSIGINRVRVVDPYDLAQCEAAIKEELSVSEPSVIISRRPCVLLKSVKAKPALSVNKDKCRSCRRCMTLGCPAISFKDGKAVVDATLCVGCGVCKQLCAFDALEGGE